MADQGMKRREFLRGLAAGVAVAAVPAILVPERKIWQVHRNTPIRGWYTREVEHGDDFFSALEKGQIDPRNNIHCADPDRVKREHLPGNWGQQPGTAYNTLEEEERLARWYQEDMLREVREGHRELDQMSRDEQVAEAVRVAEEMREEALGDESGTRLPNYTAHLRGHMDPEEVVKLREYMQNVPREFTPVLVRGERIYDESESARVIRAQYRKLSGDQEEKEEA